VDADALTGLLTPQEREAVDRRLGLRPATAPKTWVPPSAGADGSRFAAPQGRGALYLGDTLATCLKAILHHHARLCAASVGTPAGIRALFRHLVFQVAGDLADAAVVRGGGLHDPSNYAPSWGYGRRARAQGLQGVHYRSVRNRRGRCLAIFEERAVRFLRIQFGAVLLEWDGTVSRRIA
jgi:hypothetical protein